MATKVRALVLALALALGAVVAVPNTASAEIVPEFVTPRPDVSISFGYVTATIYFNWTETKLIASGGWSAATACAYVAWLGSPVAGLACSVGLPRIVSYISRYRGEGKCGGLRFYIGSPMISWAIYHTGGRCF